MCSSSRLDNVGHSDKSSSFDNNFVASKASLFRFVLSLRPNRHLLRFLLFYLIFSNPNRSKEEILFDGRSLSFRIDRPHFFFYEPWPQFFFDNGNDVSLRESDWCVALRLGTRLENNKRSKKKKEKKWKQQQKMNGTK